MLNSTFDLIIPCYCPRDGWAENLRLAAEKLNGSLSGLSIAKLIVVNDGSPNGIGPSQKSELRSDLWELCLIEHKNNMGKGAAIRSGLAVSDSEFAVFTDVDVPYLVEDMAQMLKAVSTGPIDLALGIRGETYYSELGLMRKFLSRSLLYINKKMFGLPIGDTQGGLKAMNETGRSAILETKIDRYLFDLELVQLAVRKKLNLIGVEVRLQQNIQLPGLGIVTLLQESRNFLTLFLSR